MDRRRGEELFMFPRYALFFFSSIKHYEIEKQGHKERENVSWYDCYYTYTHKQREREKDSPHYDESNNKQT